MTLPAVVVTGAGVVVEAFEGMAHPGPGLCPITDEADVEADKAGLADEVLRLTGDFPLALLIEVPLLRPKHTQKTKRVSTICFKSNSGVVHCTAEILKF